VQTVEGVPAFVHGGPFANIAHGCNSLIATRTALRLADYVVTEAGFGADLGAEKFFDITCRFGKIVPSAAVLVITRRALAVHGFDNVVKHAENIKLFGVPVVISINRFLEDSDDDLRRIEAKCADLGLEAVITDFRESGGSGGVELAQKICTVAEMPSAFRFLYELDLPLGQKIEKIAQDIYGAKGIEVSSEAREDLKRIEESGYGNFPICMAKTQTSLSDNPKITGRPRDFTITVSSARICAGAGFVVVSTGKIMTMPGLPSRPAALSIDVDSEGNITGLF
jgi:formate--tetrahydrofolate ligase